MKNSIKEKNAFMRELSYLMKYDDMNHNKLTFNDNSANTVILKVNPTNNSKQKLQNKYENILSEDNLKALTNTGFFLGMTEQMLLDSLGTPNKLTEDKLKTKIKRTYTYMFPNNTVAKSLVFVKNKLVKYKIYQMYKN